MQGYRERKGSDSDLVSASEIAAFVYCQEQWRLQDGLGLEPGNRAAMDAGTQHHERKATAEWGVRDGVRLCSWFAAHNAVGLAGESPVVGIDCLPT